MTDFYTRSAATAARMIAKFGQAAILEVPPVEAGPDYDPGQAGWSTELAVTVVDLNRKVRDTSGLVEKTQRTFYMAVPTSAPQADWRVKLGTVWHRIIEVRPLAPGGVAVMYEVDIET